MVPEKVPLYKKPEQVLNVTLLIVATGNTLTVTVNPAEVQPPGTFGVTKYVAVPTAFPVFVKVPLSLARCSFVGKCSGNIGTRTRITTCYGSSICRRIPSIGYAGWNIS